MVKDFNNTDAGIIPNDWNAPLLSEISDFENGKAHEQFIDDKGDYIVVNSKFISQEGRVAKYSKENLSPLAKGSIAIVMSDIPNGKALAKCFSIDKDNRYTLNQRIGSIIPFDEIDNDYLFYKLNRNKYFLAFDSGSGQTNLKKSEILACPVALPPTKDEQTAIATAIKKADALISQLEKLLTKKRNIKTGAMQELLKPKEGWIEKKLGNCLKGNPEYGIGAAAVVYNEALPVYLRITDITEDGKYSKKNIVSVNNINSSNYFLEVGDLVFARTGASVGKTYLYNPKDGKLVYAGFLIRIKVNPEILIPEYFQFYTQTYSYWNWIKSNSLRTGQPGINGNEYKELPIYIPKSIEEQIEIANILTSMDSEIEILEKKIEKHKMIKEGMMQSLLTGKIRLV